MNFDKITSGDTVYQFGCGCYSAVKSNKRENKVECIKHFRSLVGKYRKCNFCKNWFAVSTKSNSKIYFCEEHRPINQKILYQNYIAKHKNDEKTFPKRWNPVPKRWDPVKEEDPAIEKQLAFLDKEIKTPKTLKDFPLLVGLLLKINLQQRIAQ